MNSQRAREVQVGVMVVIGIVILVAGLMFFKRVNLSTNMKPYAVDIPAVEGLRRGDRVQVRGIRVGQVTGFDFRPDAVRVFLEIEDWVALNDDAEVVLVMKGLVGEVLLEIEPGQGERVPPGHVFTGRSAASMLELGDKVNEALDVMTSLGRDLSSLLGELREGDRLLGPLEAAGRAMEEGAGLLSENRQAINELLVRLGDLTTTLQAGLGEGKLDSTLVVTRRAAASLDSTLVELRSATREGRALLATLQSGEGAAGRFLHDPTLYDRADSTLQSLDRLLDQMRRNPKAMFKMSVF